MDLPGRNAPFHTIKFSIDDDDGIAENDVITAALLPLKPLHVNFTPNRVFMLLFTRIIYSLSPYVALAFFKHYTHLTWMEMETGVGVGLLKTTKARAYRVV